MHHRVRNLGGILGGVLLLHLSKLLHHQEHHLLRLLKLLLRLLIHLLHLLHYQIVILSFLLDNILCVVLYSESFLLLFVSVSLISPPHNFNLLVKSFNL